MPLMGIPSFSELIIIAAVVFLLFGAKKLPELGGAIGESIKNFKKGIKDDEPEAKRLAEASRAEAAAKAANVVKPDPIEPKD